MGLINVSLKEGEMLMNFENINNNFDFIAEEELLLIEGGGWKLGEAVGAAVGGGIIGGIGTGNPVGVVAGAIGGVAIYTWQNR